ncbi:MAG: hypothetical protein ACRC28_06210 [Clostridium sp.]|uniref:hypothetical protein n=1 Tax=Clostridia TaxID=186801 RepID=UPI003F348DFC
MEIGNAKEKNMIVNDGFLYYGDFSNVSATPEFIETLKGQLLGICKDKVSVSAKPKVRQIKNQSNKVKGWQVIDNWEVKVSAELKTFDDTLLESSLMSENGSGKFNAKLGVIDVENYKDLLLVGKDIKGDIVIVHVPNTYNSNGLNFDMQNKDESGFKVEFNSAYENQEVSPINIFGNFKEMVQSQKTVA